MGQTRGAWAAEQGLSVPESAPSEADLARLVGLRAALASMLTGPAGRRSPGTGARGPGRPRRAASSRPGGRRQNWWPTVMGGSGSCLQGSPGEWLESAIWAQVLLAQADGTWPRLKLCRREACGSAFYDLSRNNSGVWHDVRTCGNVVNLRASRLRKKQQAASPGDAGER